MKVYTALENTTQTQLQTSEERHRLLSNKSLPVPLSEFHNATLGGRGGWCHVQSRWRQRRSTRISSRRRAFVTPPVFPPLLWSAAFVFRSLCFAQSAFQMLALRCGLLEVNTKNMYSKATQLCAVKSPTISENAPSKKNMQYACKLSDTLLNF